MSDNESKLVFDTLIGSDTLTRTLEKQFNIATHLTTELGKIKEKVAATKAPLDATGISMVGISSLRTAVELYNNLLHGKEAVAKMATGLGLKAGDLTTLEGMVNSMHKLVGITEKYSQLDSKKLQLAAFDGTLTREQFDQHKTNINALKAMNKGFAQGQAHLDAKAQVMAKEGIKLVEEHTAALRKQNQEKVAGERQTAAEQRNRVITVAREIKEGKDHSDFIKKASALEANQLKLKLQNESLKAGLTPAQQTNISSGLSATSSHLEKLKAPKLTAPKELEFFNQLQGGSSKAKAQGTIALQEMAQHIRQLQKMGKAEELLKWTETYQQSKSAFATKFAPISPHQEQLKESRKVAQAQKLPIAEVLKLTDKGEVAKQYRLSDIRAKALPEGGKKDAEIRYQDQVKAHGLALREKEKQQKADKAAEQKIDETASLKAVQRKRKEQDTQKALDDKAKAQDVAKKAADKAAEQKIDETASLKAVQRKRKEQDTQKALDDKAKAQDVAKKAADKAAEQKDRDLTAKKVLQDRLQQEYQRQAAVAKAQSKGSKLTLATEAPKTDFDLKRSKELNVFQKARQGQLSPQDLQEFITKGSLDPKRLVRELGAIQKQSRSAELDPNVISLHGNRPSLIGGAIGIELSRLTQTIKDIGKADKDDRKKTAQEQAIKDNRLLEFREKARTGKLTAADINSEKDKNLLHSMKKGYGDVAYDNRLSPTARADALQMRNLIDERLKTVAAKPPKVLDEVGQHNALNRLARNIELQDPKHANTSSELGTRAIEQKTRQLNKAKELERVAASQYLTTQSLTGLSAEELTHAKKIVNYRKNMAGANQQQADVELKLLSHIRSIEQATADSARAAKKLATHNQRMANDPTYAAAQNLKINQEQLVRKSYGDRRQTQIVSDLRLQTKAENDRINEQARQRGTYADHAAINALNTPRQFEDARAALNYQKGVGSPAEVVHAKDMLQVLKEREALEKKSIANQTLVAELAKTHYRTAAEINTLGRSELEMAKQVLAYRIKNAATQTEAWHQQQLLNQVNTNSGLQNKAANRLNPEVQAENRAGSRERILGDAGASILTIQAGLMLNYKLLAGMQGLFSSAIGSVIELDSAFRQLQAISASTNTEMVSMKQNLILVAQASKFSAAEVGNTAVLLAQAGFSIGEISQSMKGIVALAQATGTDLGKSVDVVTSVLSVFNKGAGETDQVVNQLTEALNRSKLDINKMALGIQYAGNIAADSGITFEELTASLGAMANAGIRSGSTLGTGLRQMFIDLQKPSEKLKEKLSSLGLSLDQVDLKSYGLVGVLENLKNAGFTTGDAFKTFEVRAASAFAALSGNMEDFNQLKEGLNDTTAAFDANGVQLEALAVQLDHLKSNLGILSAEALMPVAALVRDLAKATAHAMETTEEGSGTLKGFGTVLAGITFGVAIGWLSKLAFELGGIVKASLSSVLATKTMAAAEAKRTTGLLALTGAEVNAIRVSELATIARAKLAAGTAILTAEETAAIAATRTFGATLLASAPILIGIVGTIGVVVAAWMSYGSEMEKLNEKLDKAKAAFNTAKENAETAKTTYDNVTEAIDRLGDKYGVLASNQAATTSEAESLVSQFGAMGLQFDSLANVKVPELMRKLQELRGELAKDYESKVAKELTAKIAAIWAGNEAADSVLKKSKFSKGNLTDIAEGLANPRETLLKSTFSAKSFGKEEDFGAPADLEVIKELGAQIAKDINDPTISKLLSELILEIKDVQKEGGLPKNYSLAAKEYQLSQALLSSKLKPHQIAKVQELFKDYVQTPVESYQTRENFEPDKQKAALEARRKDTRAKNDTASQEVNMAVGSSERAKLIYEEAAVSVDNSKQTLREKTLSKAALARTAVTKVKANLAEVDKILDTMAATAKVMEKANKAGSPDYKNLKIDIANKEAEKAKINEYLSALQEPIDRAKELISKEQARVIQLQIDARKKELARLQKQYEKESSKSASKILDAKVAGKQKEIEDLTEELDTIKVKGDAERAEAIQAHRDSYSVEVQNWADTVIEHNKKLEEAISREKVTQEQEKNRAALRSYADSYKDFMEEYNLNNELFNKQQKAAQRRITQQGKKLLNSGSMFKDLNKDLADKAQEAANKTGVATEYTQYDKGIGGFFARRAADAKSGATRKILKQEALARDIINLQSIEERFKKDSANYDIPKTKSELTNEQSQLETLNAKLTDPNQKDKEGVRLQRDDLRISIATKLETLQQFKDMSQGYKTEREKLLAAIENGQADLEVVDENALAFQNSFAAGRQALDAGMSTIVSDWATQSIRNIHDVEQAFKAMGLSILQSMLKVVSDRTAMAFTNLLLGKAGAEDGGGYLGKIGGIAAGFLGGLFGGGSKVPKGMTDFSSGHPVAGLASTGGFPKGNAMQRFATGGSVSGTNVGHDTVPAMLMPNEFVLKPSATSALGKPFLDRLNSVTTGSLKQLDGKAQAPQVSVVQSPPTNVYVVSPDQKQQMGPNDVVVILEDNISRGGSIKRLIKQVVSGEA